MKFVISYEAGAQAAAQNIESALRGHSVVANKVLGDISVTPASEMLAGGTYAYNSGTKTHTFTSTSSRNDLRWELSFPGAASPNSGRVIVVGAANRTSSPLVISDTGGTPAARLATGQLTGTGASWSFVAGVANDLDYPALVVSVVYKNDIDANDGAVVPAASMNELQFDKLKTAGAKIIRVIRDNAFDSYAESAAAGPLDIVAAINAIETTSKQRALRENASRMVFDAAVIVTHDQLRSNFAGTMQRIQQAIGLTVETLVDSGLPTTNYETKFSNWNSPDTLF